MKHRSWLIVGVLGFVGLAAGCGSTHQPPATSTSVQTPTSAAPTTPSPTTASPTTASAATSSTPTTAAPTTTPTLAACSTSHLTGSLGSPNGTAGTIYYQLGLRNTGSAVCSVQGYPGVSFVAGPDGHQVGSPATRIVNPAPRVVLSPQQQATSTLAVVEAGNFGSSCQVTPVLGLRVYPPGQTSALFVAHADQGCANSQVQTLRVGPLQPG